MTRVVGVDPGINGAVALISNGEGHSIPTVKIVDLCTIDTENGNRIDWVWYRDLLQRWKPDVAYIEAVWPRPVGSAGGGMGFTSAGRFMKTCGGIEALTICDVPKVFPVTPHQWKKFFKLTASKEEARARMIELFPESVQFLKRKKDHNRAESLAIAAFGACRQEMLKLETT